MHRDGDYVPLSLCNSYSPHDTLNQNRIICIVDKPEKMRFPEEHTATSTKCMFGVNITGNTEVIDVDCDGQSASGRFVRKRTRESRFEEDDSDQYILLRPSKSQKSSSTTERAGGFMDIRIGGTKDHKYTNKAKEAKVVKKPSSSSSIASNCEVADNNGTRQRRKCTLQYQNCI